MDKMTYLLFRQDEKDAQDLHLSPVERQFPRIAEHLVEVWNSSDCDDYLNTLVIDERCDRHGFPPEVMDDLMLLENVRWALLHDDELPQLATHILQYRFSETQASAPQASHDGGPQGWIKRTFGL